MVATKAELRSLRQFSSHQSLAEALIACRPCLDDQWTWSTLGLHLVYTWSTLGLHSATMSNYQKKHKYVLVAEDTVGEYQKTTEHTCFRFLAI